MSKLAKIVECSIEHQGAPVVNCGVIFEKFPTAVLAIVDLKTKWCEIDAGCEGKNGCPAFYVSATKRSTGLKKGVKKTEPTKIAFPEFKDWRVFSVNLNRYSLYITFVK